MPIINNKKNKNVKFISIPVTSKGNQLLNLTEVKLVAQATTATVTVTYSSGKVATITHAVAGAADYSMRDIIQDAMVAMLKDSWTHVSMDAPALPFAVSAIAIA